MSEHIKRHLTLLESVAIDVFKVVQLVLVSANQVHHFTLVCYDNLRSMLVGPYVLTSPLSGG